MRRNWYGLSAASGSSSLLETENQVFQPGIAIPAGDAIGFSEQNDSGAVQIYGYLVPASSVPRAAVTAGMGHLKLKLPRTRQRY